MMEIILRKYAKLAVKIGANVQQNQYVLVNSPVDCASLARLVVEEAYAAGAKYVYVNWSDELVSRQHYLNCSVEQLEHIPSWMVGRLQDAVDQNACLIAISAPTPGLMGDVDPMKMQKAAIASQKALQFFSKYTAGNQGQWNIVAMPTAAWARKVFTNISDEEAVEKLWEAILSASRVTEDNDPVAEWTDHMNQMARRNTILNEYNFKTLHFKNELGTDFTLDLVKDHIWAGGGEHTTKGVYFAPNIPTEEAFTMPEKTGVNGVVYSTKPLNYQGKLIEDFWLRFEHGKVVDFDAKKEKETLQSLLEFDEGSCYLGEVALVPDDSPISNSKILFMNTLFDENASCHLALGRAYPMNVKGGTQMTDEQLTEAGANLSLTHVDFMFGDATMHIAGTKYDGTEVVVFDKGNFVF